jgi:hypothetical protein
LDAEQSSSRGAALGESATPSQSSGAAAGYNAHVPEKCRAGLEVANAGKPLAALNGDTTEILARLRNGARVQDLATEYGVGHPAMYEWLMRHCPDEWTAISAGKSLARMEQAEADLDAAQDNTQVSKARESHRMGQWTLERVARRLYGDSKPDSSGITVQVIVARDGIIPPNIIDAETA